MEQAVVRKTGSHEDASSKEWPNIEMFGKNISAIARKQFETLCMCIYAPLKVD